jgi:hypothetical protein
MLKRQIAEQTEEAEIDALIASATAASPELLIERGIRIGEQQQLAVRAIRAPPRRIALARPVIGTVFVLDDDDAAILCCVSLNMISSVAIGAAIEDEDDLQVRVRLLSQARGSKRQSPAPRCGPAR